MRRESGPHGRIREVRGSARSGAHLQAAGVDIRRALSTLIIGTDVGAGSFAIQLAKLPGAVTDVINAGNLDFVRGVAADGVVDSRSKDITRLERYDLVLDLVAHRSAFTYRALVRGGRYLCVAEPYECYCGS